MYRKFALAALAVVATAPMHNAQAQSEPRRYRVAEPGRAFAWSFSDDDENRAVIGVTTASGSVRDTLGVLVSSVAVGGPAEKAGIEEGTRIAAINGVNLKLSPADVGDWDMSDIMSRRLTRELRKVKPGDDVELRLYSSGQNRTVKVKTVSSDSLYRKSRMAWNEDDDRAALGISLGSSGSKRDTLGVLVMWLDDNGPAAKAGLEEGNRIAAINGVDLRVSREDAGDDLVSGLKVQRLQRELEKVKAGDDVTLRVYADGRTKDVKIKTVQASSLGSRGFFFGGARPRIAPMPAVPPMPPMPGMDGMRMRISRVTI